MPPAPPDVRSIAAPWRATAAGCELSVRLTPKSSREGIDGIMQTQAGSTLMARVRAVPEDGKANAALEVLIAGWLGVAKSLVRVVRGQTSRLKTVEIAGDGAAIMAMLAARLSLPRGVAGRSEARRDQKP